MNNASKQQKYNEALKLRLAGYQQKIRNALAIHAKEAANIALKTSFTPDADKPFSFDDYLETRRAINALLKGYANDMQTTIVAGIGSEWRNSELCQDLLLKDVMRKTHMQVDGERVEHIYKTDEAALQAFIQRKEAGMNLSQRVWNLTDEYKEDLEAAISVGIEKGQTAQTLSKRIAKYLVGFDALQRDFKQKFGRAARVENCEYRAARLARTEINMAYRTAEQNRWRKLDFVLGYEVKLSHSHGHTYGQHGACEVCEALAGKYPKTFVFEGWHPNCMCYAVPILPSVAEMREYLDNDMPADAFSRDLVQDTPEGFNEYVKANNENLQLRNPYWYKHNQSYVNEALNPTPTQLSPLEIAAQRHAARTPEQAHAIKDAWKERKERISQQMNDAERFIPQELRVGGSYLGTSKDGFDPEFFRLVDPNKPIKLTIDKRIKGSYCTGDGKDVVIADSTRNILSPWHKRTVIYHEYGHAIDAQRTLWQDKELLEMRKRQIADLKKRSTYSVWQRRYIAEKYTYVSEKRDVVMSKAQYIDYRLNALCNKIHNMDAKTFAKYGITREDVMEQICSTADTLKSLVHSCGYGHSSSYFSRRRNSETEYLAHAFENTFLGNRVFKKYMPDVYSDMVSYIRNLKPMQ